jgi:hypothetical protein
VPLEPAANDALTREIEALRDALVDAGVELARGRDEQEILRTDLRRLRDGLRDRDDSQRDFLAHLRRVEDAD